MGANFSNQKGDKKRRVISDINITPFVDILLVLLIIFMVAAPMMTSGIDVTLPKGASSPISEKTKPLSISIKADGSIFVEEEMVKLGVLPKKLLDVTGDNLNNKIYVRADQKLDYGRVMDVVKSINATGFNQVILVTELVQ
jgi:biopolymer transport protein TolR